MTAEQWRVLKEFPKYAVSNFGRLKRVQSSPQHPADRVLLGTINNKGRRMYGLYQGGWRNGTIKLKQASRLVAEAFLERPADGAKCLVLHSDGDPLNNHVSNLKWGTYKENAADALGHGTFVVGSKNGQARLTEDIVRTIQKRRTAGETQQSLAEEYGVTKTAISSIDRRVSWAHVT